MEYKLVSWITYRFRRGSQVYHELFIVQMMSDDLSDLKWPLVRWIQRMLWICFWKERKNQSAAEANMMKLKSQWKMFGKYVIDLFPISSAWPQMTCIWPKFQFFEFSFSSNLTNLSITVTTRFYVFQIRCRIQKIMFRVEMNI